MRLDYDSRLGCMRVAAAWNAGKVNGIRVWLGRSTSSLLYTAIDRLTKESVFFFIFQMTPSSKNKFRLEGWRIKKKE